MTLLPASALSCYACNSEGDTCADEQLVECDALTAGAGMALLLMLKPSIQVIPSTNYQCYTLVAEQKLNNYKTVIKSCIYDTVQVCDGTPLNSEQKQCKSCIEDGCNGSNQIRASYGVMISVITVAVATIFGNKY